MNELYIIAVHYASKNILGIRSVIGSKVADMVNAFKDKNSTANEESITKQMIDNEISKRNNFYRDFKEYSIIVSSLKNLEKRPIGK